MPECYPVRPLREMIRRGVALDGSRRLPNLMFVSLRRRTRLCRLRPGVRHPVLSILSHGP